MIERLTKRLVLGLSLFLPITAHSEQFSIVVIPDTQWYAELSPEILESQIDWIIDPMQAAENIIYVAHLGDLKDDLDCNNNMITAGTGGNRTEWQIVRQAFNELDAVGMAYGVVPGNHDFDQQVGGPNDGSCPDWEDERPLSLYNINFGPSEFAGEAYYGGNRVMNSNEDNFTLFESNGVKFVSVNLAYKEAPDSLNTGVVGNPDLQWADDRLKDYPDRIGIVTSHNLLRPNGTLDDYGQEVYDALSNNPNLMTMMSAHRFGEAWLEETTGRAGMGPVQILLADYQEYSFPGDGDPGTDPDLPNPDNIDFLNIGGPTSRDSGFMRIMRFDTVEGMVNISTFIPPETVINGRTQTLVSDEVAMSGADMDGNSATNLSYTYLGYAPISVLIDFDTRQDGTPYAGTNDLFPADEYDGAVGVVINDTDPAAAETFVDEINPLNVGTDISGFYANIGAFAPTPQTQLTLDFATAVTDVAFDFATTDGMLTVTAFDAGAVSLGVIMVNGTDPFINQAGFNVNAGHVDISGIGEIASLLIEPSLNHALIFDNLDFTTVVSP